ncbi:MAG: GNAT family N-acetyltransferase [Rubrivivax sp.]|nr:GNAT family N-acetyltransferase [Rubrivivax sp.]
MADAAAGAIDYHTRVHDDPRAVAREAWNALLARQAEPTLFMRHEYLVALHESGSAVPRTGWAPRFVTLHDDRGTLRAAAALYLKAHSYGEYVFDWAWAEAYHRHGLRYYPKLLGAVPFTPVPGTRLLADSAPWRDRLVAAIHAQALDAGLSSAHVIFTDDEDTRALARAGWMVRHGVQFHWRAPEDAAPGDFTAFLATLQRDKRKKIAQERRRVAEQGITFTTHAGEQIDEPLWDFFHRCYTLTYRAHHSTPYLTRAFFAAMARTLAGHWVLFVARRGGAPIGGSLIAVDPARRIAYGRYWGATEYVPCLHFEACYYQPLAWCLAHGYRRFEGGAQGEHKMARGLLPVRTNSVHWLRDERFAAAVADFLAAEGEHVDGYVDELRERNPFKAVAAGDDGAG